MATAVRRAGSAIPLSAPHLGRSFTVPLGKLDLELPAVETGPVQRVHGIFGISKIVDYTCNTCGTLSFDACLCEKLGNPVLALLFALGLPFSLTWLALA